MKLHRLPAVIFCAASLSGAAFAQTQPQEPHDVHGLQSFQAKFAGVCTNKDDFSLTGAPLFNGTNPNSGAIRIFCNLAGDSTHGHFIAQFLVDLQPQQPHIPCILPGGGAGGGDKLPAWLFILSFDETQDQLFLSSSSGTDCGPILSGPPTIFTPTYPRTVFSVLGGTGHFEGASGTISLADTTIVLALSRLATVGVVSANAGTLDGSVNLK
jgi:hypothetical protein